MSEAIKGLSSAVEAAKDINEYEGFSKFTADTLPKEQAERLRKLYAYHEATESLKPEPGKPATLPEAQKTYVVQDKQKGIVYAAFSSREAAEKYAAGSTNVAILEFVNAV